MNDMHQPPSGDPQDYWPTQELGPTAGYPGHAHPGHSHPGPAPQPGPSAYPGQAPQPGLPWGQPSGPAWGQPSGPGAHPSGPRPRRGRVLWWSAGLALVALLAGGGALAASSSASRAPAGPTGQAAVLNSMLSSASSPGADGTPGNAATTSATAGTRCLTRAAKLKSAGHPYAAQVTLGRCRHALRGIRALGGIHGQFTFETKSGTRTIAYERGVIQSVSGSDVVVQAKDGTTWTWVLESNTVIRESGKRVTASSLSAGEQVFAGGPVVSGADEARLIAIRPSSGRPSPSPASGS